MNKQFEPRVSIHDRYIDRTERSASLAERARDIYPSGITHDARYHKPYTIYVDRAEGPRKWDVDGNEYIDYVGGHGGLMAGHAQPDIVRAVQEAVTRGTQLGGNSVDEVEYGELIKELVPCAERVRLTMSGTEATLLALRLARAFTGRHHVIQIRSNFHGWHDQVASTYSDLPSSQAARGVVPAITEYSVPVPPGDIDALSRALDENDDVAAVLLEPTGTHFGQLPLPPGYLQAARELTRKKNVILIFDEVITGFRISPGGAQAFYDITPDMSTHAKIICGGLPGGAVCGRKDILDVLDFDEMHARNEEKVLHNGTFNANLASTAAGLAMLKLIRDSDVCARANAAGERLREGLKRLIKESGLPWAVYGEFSGFFIFTNPSGRDINPDDFDPLQIPYMELKRSRPDVATALINSLLNHGVHIMRWPGGLISSTHNDAIIDETLERTQAALVDLQREMPDL